MNATDATIVYSTASRGDKIENLNSNSEQGDHLKKRVKLEIYNTAAEAFTGIKLSD